MNNKFLLVQTSLMKPRDILKKIHERPEDDISLILVLVYGATRGLGYISKTNWPAAFLIPIASAFGAVIGTMFYAYLLDGVTRLFSKAEAFTKIRFTLPYALVPLIIGNVVVLITDEKTDRLLNIAFELWFIGILTILLSQLKNISLYKSVLSIIIATLIVVGPILIVYSFLYR